MIYSDQLCISIIFPSQSAAYTKTAFFPPSYSVFTSSPICLPPFSSNSSNVFSTSSTLNARCAVPHLFKVCRDFLYISGMIPLLPRMTRLLLPFLILRCHFHGFWEITILLPVVLPCKTHKTLLYYSTACSA